MDSWREFHGPNAGYVQALYERYQRDPASVDPASRAYFDAHPPGGGLPGGGFPGGGPQEGDDGRAPEAPQTRGATGHEFAPEKIMGVVNLANAIRDYGHLAARLDPLGAPPPGDPALDPATHGLTDADLAALPGRLIGGPIGEESATALDAIAALRAVYSSHTGYDYEQVRLPEARAWLRETAEARSCCSPFDPIDPVSVLARLTQVEVFEHFLQKFYPGKTRFSIEGLDMLVPILDDVIGAAAEDGVVSILIGMAHRGRLNVLAHVLQKPYAQILAEFKDPLEGQHFYIRDDLGWTGDVKYHKGARRAITGGELANVIVSMIPNPSHLEFVNPVVEGMARAAVTRVDQPGAPIVDERLCLPILIHGDASFPGQGIVSETLNLQTIEGYRTGGAIHIIANNQLGFTAERREVCSTLYVSDLAKGFKIPIIHVNADDPEACINAARTAIAYTQQFERDFLIDLVGYRRYGHNEGDDPTFTQPRMYQVIDAHPTVRSLWAQKLVAEGVIPPDEPDRLVQARMAELQAIAETLQPSEEMAEAEAPPQAPPKGAARRVQTAVPAADLRGLNEALLTAPPGFTLNPRLARVLDRRRKAFAEADAADVVVDWAAGEALALASILADGAPIRLTGEDAARGTFSHRHGVWIDVATGRAHIPHQALPQARAAFEIYNSPLTEEAILGFEYGYSIYDPKRLVIWEAQYGDFVNGAQVIIDQYLVSARAKWGHEPSLVLLLPHGYEGQGPEHSSARVERFLQSAAETNLRIANPTTAAQYFHLLRRQAALLETDPLPLIVLTPKSLLRSPLAASTLRELSEGRWQGVLDDAETQADPAAVRRLILCSGKVWADLRGSSLREGRADVALVRLEQLYIFPQDEVAAVLARYNQLAEVVWLQEEPENMGAWEYVRPRLLAMLEGLPLRYIGRPRASSPSEGSFAWHAANQKRLIEQAFARGE